MSVTQAQLARELGLSQVAVSHALLGKPGVGARTRQRVLDAARRGGYRPSRSARGMVSGRTQLIDLWLGLKTGVSRTPPNLLQSMQFAAESAGMQVLLSFLHDRQLSDPNRLPTILREHAADGVLINYTHLVPEPLLELLTRYAIPAVWVNNKREHDAVHPDDLQIGRLAAERFLELGHRRLAMFEVTGGEHYSRIDRWDGFRITAEAAGLTPRRIEVPGGLGVPYRQDATHDDRVDQLVARLDTPDRPTAIFAYSLGEALAVVAALGRLGLSTPQDVSLIAVADEPVSVLVPVPISTVVLPQDRIGAAAVEELVAKIDRPADTRPAIALPAKYVESRSTARPPSKSC
ncbi:MAG: LacI family DNA-binding transcriptional regulator [Planctomycetota bacterium]